MPHFSAVYGSSLKTELERNKTDDKAVSLHRYSSFYFVFDILEREKSFQIGPVVIPKEVVDIFKPETIRPYENESLAKFVTLLKKINDVNEMKEENLSEAGKLVQAVTKPLGEFMKINNVSYQSLLVEGLGSIHKTHDFDRKGHPTYSSSSPSP